MHTPGPWKIEPDGSIVGDTGNSYTPVASFVDNEADAALITAAPRMLKVLRKVYTALQTIETGYEHIDAEVRDVIAEATAEATQERGS